MMKITQLRSPHAKHSKNTKRSKGGKKPSEKELRDSDSNESQDPTIPQVSAKRSSSPVDQKKSQLEKRKQEGSEWKALKKIDYQRLETVLEEGQLSGEETPSKHNDLEDSGKSESESDSDQPPLDARFRRSRIYNLVSIAEHPELWNSEEEQQENNKKFVCRNTLCEAAEEGSTTAGVGLITREEAGNEESRGEPTAKDSEGKIHVPKRNLSLNGMMEILPIFSNDKFLCSRDAISIEESDDLEALDKNIFHKYPKPSEPKKETGQNVDERLGDTKESDRRKKRHKIFTDKNPTRKTSSHFINSLLVLTPFAADKENLLKDKTLNGTMTFEDDLPARKEFSSPNEVGRENEDWELKALPALFLITLGALSVGLAIAWKSYEPPCFLDHILDFIPFIHRRRTFVQLFFDKLLKVLSDIFIVSCKAPFFSVFVLLIYSAGAIAHLFSFCFQDCLL